MNFIWQAIGGLLSPLTEMAKEWQARKRARLENDLALAKATTEAKIQRVMTAQEADIKWEFTALEGSGIKDEVMMAVILTPMVLCFFGDWGAGVVAQGFTAIRDNVPIWWQSAFGATVAVSYGLKKFADFKSFGKGA